MGDLSTGVLILIFVAAAVATWIAGVALASATDVIDDAYGLGQALGGMILLSIVGSLPELAITLSAATSGDLGIAAGNLIGGVAIQTLVLAVADRFVRGDRPLTAIASSLVPALEGMLVIAVVAVTMMSGLLPESAAIGSVGAGSIAIVAIWIVGMKVLAGVKDRPDLVFASPLVGASLAAAAATDPPIATTTTSDGDPSPMRLARCRVSGRPAATGAPFRPGRAATSCFSDSRPNAARPFGAVS